MTNPYKDEIRVGGLTRYSACDFPGALSAVVFLQGCPWACPYCHNPDLRPAVGNANVPWADIVAFLRTRVGLLDAVVFSGGEPLMQAALPQALTEVKTLGFAVGLHTGGCAPERFAAVLPLTDWVGFDVKAPFSEYEAITGVAASGDKARASLSILIASGKDFELRTTVHPRLLDGAAIERLNDDLVELGVGPTKIQPFRAQGCIDRKLIAGSR